MSVTGFLKDGSIQKYDYNALDNKPNDGLTEATKSALLQLARKVAYIDEHGEDYYQNLYDSFYSNFVSITAMLTNCYSSNMSTTVKEGAAYSATIYANPGYSLTGANVSITMGGLNVIGAYSNGAINIPNVTGDLVIVVTAMSPVSSITAVYTQSGTVYTTATLDSLKADLVVTAAYSDSSTATVAAADYTLSGTLAEGTSTITVSYIGKTTTFDVTVTAVVAENISNVPITVRITGSGASWNSNTLVATINSTGAWDGIILQKLKYKFSAVSAKTFRIRCNYVITGVTSATTGSGVAVAVGLYVNNVPGSNASADRKASLTLPESRVKENGTFAIDVSKPLAEIFTGTGLDNYYLGLTIFNNCSSGVTATISDIIAEVY